MILLDYKYKKIVALLITIHFRFIILFTSHESHLKFDIAWYWY
jgi:hypothetical protein